MTVADLSKSLVHIQERYIAPGTITVTHDFDVVGNVIPVVGVTVGDSVIVQPSTSADVANFESLLLMYSWVPADDQVVVMYDGSLPAGDTEIKVTVFGRGF